MVTKTFDAKLPRPVLTITNPSLADIRAHVQAEINYLTDVILDPLKYDQEFDSADQRESFLCRFNDVAQLICVRGCVDEKFGAAIKNFCNLYLPSASEFTHHDEETYLNQAIYAEIQKQMKRIAGAKFAFLSCDNFLNTVVTHIDPTRPLSTFLDEVAFNGRFIVDQKVRPDSLPLYESDVLYNPTWRTILKCADAAIIKTGFSSLPYLKNIEQTGEFHSATKAATLRLDFTD